MDYAPIFEQIEELLHKVPVDQLRRDVAHAESLIGKNKLTLPSGRSFDLHTRRARLWLDFLEDLAELESEHVGQRSKALKQ